MVTAADRARTDTYGDATKIPDKVNAILGASAANAQDVADVVLAVVETPAGQRQLRYRISPTDLGLEAINKVCAEVQSRFVEGFGIAPETTFTQQHAATAD